MAEFRIQFTERFREQKDHTGIVFTVPDEDVSDVNELINIINNIYENDPNLPLKSILDKIVSQHDNWAWAQEDYDAYVRVPCNYNLSKPCYLAAQRQ